MPFGREGPAIEAFGPRRHGTSGAADEEHRARRPTVIGDVRLAWRVALLVVNVARRRPRREVDRCAPRMPRSPSPRPGELTRAVNAALSDEGGAAGPAGERESA
jgi:hypothetical protein